VIHQGVGVVVVVGVCIGVGQVVGQLAQRIVLPNGPADPPLKPANPVVDVPLRIPEVVTPKPLLPQGALEIGGGIS